MTSNPLNDSDGSAPEPLDVDEEVEPRAPDIPVVDSPEPAERSEGYELLKQILLAPERENIQQLQDRFDDTARFGMDVSRVLPTAIELRSQRDSQLTVALRPAVEEAVTISVKRDPSILVDALFPVMGPAIRRAVSAALSDMIQTLNRTLENSFSWKGLTWRLESLRTGRPFSEIVLIHSLVYRVEQVYLIHRETGLLLNHVVAADIESPDPDLISGMLTAIQDFARDSFGAKEGESLRTFEIGDLNCSIEVGPHAVIAGVIRGEVISDVRNQLQDALSIVHADYLKALTSFEGDTTSFESTTPILEDCLQSQFAQQDEGPSKTLIVVACSVLLLVVGWVGYSMWNSWRWNGYLEAIERQPGIVVTETGERDGKFYVAGLRDPLARDPNEFLADAGIDSDEITSRWEPYISSAPEFLEQRLTTLLSPPETVSMTVDGTVLKVSGSARHAWISQARRLFRTLPGLLEMDESQLEDTDYRDLYDLKAKLESSVLMFTTNSSEPAPGQEENWKQVLDVLRNLIRSADRQGADLLIDIVGHTDSTGTEATNERLSSERAERIFQELTESGLSTINMRSVGVSTQSPVRDESTPEDAAFNRSVTFQVRLD